MKMPRVALAVCVALTICTAARGQEKASVQTDKSGPFRPGAPIVFHVRLNEPLPEGARFDLRISPTSADEEVSLGSGEPDDASRKDFRIAGKLPDGALPGEWHISVIWLFLPGSGWTHNTIAPNALKFQVEGKPYQLPTKAEVSVGK